MGHVCEQYVEDCMLAILVCKVADGYFHFYDTQRRFCKAIHLVCFTNTFYEPHDTVLVPCV